MNAKLPPMPAVEVHRATWDDGVGWSQYHDEHDPLPTKWDDEPPDEVCGFYSIHQLEADRLAVWNAAIEAAAQIATEHATPGGSSGHYFGGYSDAAKRIGAAIRAMGDLKG